MSISQLFKRARRKPRPPGESTVGFFGKLPTEGDFIRLNANSALVLSFDQWLSSVVATVESGMPDWASRQDVVRFCYRDEPGERCMVGAMTPSSDRSGRHFPLVIFSELDAMLVAQDVGALPHEPLIARATQLLDQAGGRPLDRPRLLGEVQRLRPPSTDSMALAGQRRDRYVDNTDCATAFASIFGLSHLVQQHRAVAGLKATSAALRAERSGTSRFGLRCPLGNRASENASLWLTMLRALAPEVPLPLMLWDDHALLVYFHKLPSRCLLSLWSQEAVSADQTISDLATTQADGPEIELQLPLRQLLAAL